MGWLARSEVLAQVGVEQVPPSAVMLKPSKVPLVGVVTVTRPATVVTVGSGFTVVDTFQRILPPGVSAWTVSVVTFLGWGAM
jgi:hypothetical protein